MTDRGGEIARLVPSGGHASAYGRLAAELGASVPEVDLLDVVVATPKPEAAPSLDEVLDELREDRA